MLQKGKEKKKPEVAIVSGFFRTFAPKIKTI